MRYKTDEDRELERQEMLDETAKVKKHLAYRIKLIDQKMKAEKLLVKYAKKQK